MDSLKVNCPAKLNLNLSVLGKRTDGMHEIKTHFQLINLFDEMLIKKTSSKSISVKTNLGASIDGKKNICTKGSTFLIPSNVPHSGRALSQCIIMDVFSPKRDDLA